MFQPDTLPAELVARGGGGARIRHHHCGWLLT